MVSDYWFRIGHFAFNWIAAYFGFSLAKEADEQGESWIWRLFWRICAVSSVWDAGTDLYLFYQGR